MNCRRKTISIFISMVLIGSVWSKKSGKPKETYSVATASFGTMWVSVGIFGEKLTRPEAANRCVEYGYDTLEDGGLNYIRYIAIKQKLQELMGTDFTKQQTSLWADFFRIDIGPDIWYHTTLCLPATERVDFNGSQVAEGRNCVAVHFCNDFNKYYHTAMLCGKRISFLCVKTDLELPPFKIYSNAAHQDIPPGCHSYSRLNIDTYESCEDVCRILYDCIAVTYNGTSKNCTLLYIGFNKAWLTYPLISSPGDVHGAKDGILVTYYSSSTTSVTSPVSGTLPTCGTSVTSAAPSPSVTYSSSVSVPSTPVSTVITVTAYIGYYISNIYDFYEEELTWFDARSRCSGNDAVLSHVTDLGPLPITKIKQFLSDQNYKGKITFWYGHFKPNHTNNEWFWTNSNASECYQSDESVLSGNTSVEARCSVVTFTGLNINDTAFIAADSCSQTYPYFCAYNPGEVLTFIEYDGWSHSYIPDNAYENVYYVNTTVACKEACLYRWACVGWSFFHDQYQCYTIVANIGYGHATYGIAPSRNYVTHGYKGPYQMTLHPVSPHSHTTGVQQVFPTCNFTYTTTTSIPSTNSLLTETSTPSKSIYFTQTLLYSTTASPSCKRSCPCQNLTIYNSPDVLAVIDEIVRNLTVNKAETSKARRELTSAEDSRTSARVVGGLGIAFLSVVFAGIVVLDLPRLLLLLKR